jgi:signal transduction histidine kinase
LKVIRRFIGTVPTWSFVPVLVVIFVQIVNLVNLSRMPVSGENENLVKGYWIIDYVDPGGSVDKAGIKAGDTIVSCNSYTIEDWGATDHGQLAGDTLVFGILRNNLEIGYPVVIISRLKMASGFYWPAFFIIVFVSAGSLYILYKKPRDKAAKLFFLYIQQFAVMAIGGYWPGPDPASLMVIIAFHAANLMLGPTLINFHLSFPEPAKILNWYRRLPLLFYLIGLIIFIPQISNIIGQLYFNSIFEPLLIDFFSMGLWWLTITSAIALTIAIFRFTAIKDTLTRNQLRIVVIGSFCGLIPPILFTIFPDYFSNLWNIYPNLVQILQGTGSLIMIFCILIAIFLYRIWDIEVILRKALLYLGATMVIILSYLSLLYLVDLLTINETKTIRFVILAVSVIVFLMMRDMLQRLIDRVFHREIYDSATVVSDFEEKMAGIFRTEDLRSRIATGLDEIFHFRMLMMNLKKEGMIYETAFVFGSDDQNIVNEIEINREFELKLRKSTVFSPWELEEKPAFLAALRSELIVPLMKDDQPYGFFLCGQKKSEKTYSMQDIRVLSLIAKRVIALFHTAALYQNDIDRQLMLERERARISQDMHDDVGASLTRISMMSDLVKNRTDVGDGARQWLGQISDTSRGLMEEMSQIIWALNPKNDNFEGLVAYIRRFAFEYLEPTPIICVFDLPEGIPDSPLSVEVRRNVYLVVREALHNVVKHSGAMKVRVNLDMNEHGFRIRIKDDGKGFDPGKLEFPGNGLINMKKRMNDIGGELGIISETRAGTEIQILVRIG